MQKMKKPVVVALVAAFGLSVAACSTGSTVGGLAGGTAGAVAGSVID